MRHGNNQWRRGDVDNAPLPRLLNRLDTMPPKPPDDGPGFAAAVAVAGDGCADEPPLAAGAVDVAAGGSDAIGDDAALAAENS